METTKTRLVDKLELFYTNGRVFTPIQCVDHFSGNISSDNMGILVDHLSDPELAEYITAVTENEGVLAFKIGDDEGFVEVTKNNNK